MGLAIFAVTHAEVRSHYFPSLAAFASGTKPTSTAVGQMIDEAAARLAGALAAEGITAAVISADAGASYPNAYALCQSVMLQDAGIRVMQSIAGAGAVPKEWRSEVEAFYERLDERGYVALADAPAPALNANGPRSHIIDLGLYTGDTADESDAVPRFRRDDML
jgi:hypothetical protein